MKKTLSIILCLVMVLSLVAVSISAAPKADSVGKVAASYKPEGTGIASLAEITDPAGKYYLTKDITVTETFATEFTGTFDGNGKTITTSVALFNKVNNATIKNIIVKGEINLGDNVGVKQNGAEATASDNNFVAAVATVANGSTTFKNILSEVDISATSAKTRAAAIAGTSEKDYDLTIDTCVNKGDITLTSYAGGIYGWTDKAGNGVVKNCANYGKISATAGYVGGVINRMSNKEGSLTVEGCVNYGDVSAVGDQSAGILALGNSHTTMTNCINYGKITGTKHVAGVLSKLDKDIAGGTEDAPKVHKISNCANFGEVTSTGTTSGYVAGVVGYVYSGKTYYPDVQNCINTGAVKGGLYAAQILGYANSNLMTIKNNLAAGSLASNGDSTNLAFYSGSSANFSTNENISGNYIVENDGTRYYTYTATAANSANIVELANAPEGAVIVVTAAQLASGEVAHKLNTAIGKDVFKQTLGKDAVPSFTGKTVLKNVDGTYSNPETPATGDMTVVLFLVAVATLGSAVVIGKKVSAR